MRQYLNSTARLLLSATNNEESSITPREDTMIVHTTTQESRPAYHEGLLLVKLRPSAVSMAASFTATGLGGGTLHTPGFAAMAVFERAGLLKKITPLARPSDQAMPAGG